MKIVCAPDSFKGSIDAVSAAAAMASGIYSAMSDVSIDECPIGDGGEGTLRALTKALDGRRLAVSVSGLHGQAVEAEIACFDSGNFCFVESAEAIGIQTLAEPERDIMTASSFGVGELMLQAGEQDTARILVGLGGSATNDGGCGMAQALGIKFFDEADRLIDTPLAGGSLHRIHRIDASSRSSAAEETDVIALCDVTNPLTGPNGAAAVFGPQKGASAEAVEQLDQGLAHLADVVRRDLDIDISGIPGAGAAGGLGAGMVAFADARLVSGIETILDAVDFRSRVDGASLCLTGEGRIDGQSLSGKACMGVARVAADAGVPVVALVGSAGPDASRCLDAGLTDFVVIGQGLDVAESMRRAAALLAECAAAAVKKYRPNDATING
ncbi:MAG: glycerate kinase [Gammaproteobacteria bacterium]|nr:glycerate kinase [Gammaproteobacteria bacterium]